MSSGGKGFGDLSLSSVPWHLVNRAQIRRSILENPVACFAQVLPTLPFRALQELNLDKNFLVDFAALAGLRSLGVLRLSHNRIEVVRPSVSVASFLSPTD